MGEPCFGQAFGRLEDAGAGLFEVFDGFLALFGGDVLGLNDRGHQGGETECQDQSFHWDDRFGFLIAA